VSVDSLVVVGAETGGDRIIYITLSSARDKSSLSTVYILVPPGPIRHTCLVTLAGRRRRLRGRRLPVSLLGKSVSGPHNDIIGDSFMAVS
jgi:hypothetical protein